MVIIDKCKFGEDIKITRVTDNTCKTTVKVQISPTFYGWLVQFGNRLTVVEPEDVKEEISQVV